MKTTNWLCLRAEMVAKEAHQGQYDKAGEPYIEHCRRVAERVRGDDMAEVVAWLHDVMEDSPGFGGRLLEFGEDVVAAVMALTRFHGEHPAAYYERVKANPVALKVKLADVADNADEARLARLDWETAERLRKKYKRAVMALRAK